MRLITTFHDPQSAKFFTSFLTLQGIDNQLDVVKSNKWESEDYGVLVYQVWVFEEDQTDEALKWLKSFEQNPDHPAFQEARDSIARKFPPVDRDWVKRMEEEPSVSPLKRAPSSGRLTFYFLVVCVLLFFYSQLTMPPVLSPPPNFPYIPFCTAPIKKLFFFDYPKAYAILDQLIRKYGVEKFDQIADFPQEGQILLQQYFDTPYWQGFYGRVVEFFRDPSGLIVNAPLFESARQGELWRFFTPCLLHNDLFHLLFNMIWLLVLGRQIEERVGAFRLLLFILTVAIVTNVAQYLMSGSNFLGFSGVLCAMITFIWFRKKRAPWEGYQLPSLTMAFVTLFVLSMFIVQLFSFLLEINDYPSLTLGIANTAHLVGGGLGYVLSALPFFKWRTF